MLWKNGLLNIRIFRMMCRKLMLLKTIVVKPNQLNTMALFKIRFYSPAQGFPFSPTDNHYSTF